MKLLAFLATSAFVFVASQATAQDVGQAPVRHAAAPALHDPAPAGPRSEPKPEPAAAPARRSQTCSRSQACAQASLRSPRAAAATGGPAELLREKLLPRLQPARPPAFCATRVRSRNSNRLPITCVRAATGCSLEIVLFHHPAADRGVSRKLCAWNHHRASARTRLYYVLGNGQALQYAVAVGREGAAWSGTSVVTDKREWPGWTPTPEILRRQPNLPRHMEGGPQNPMGARALYLGDDALSHPRHQRALDDRRGSLVRLHPHDQRRRDRSL